MSRLSVRLSWWKKHAGEFSLPDAESLEQFRKAQRRPAGQVLLVSSDGEASYYSKQSGLGNG